MINERAIIGQARVIDRQKREATTQGLFSARLRQADAYGRQTQGIYVERAGRRE